MKKKMHVSSLSFRSEHSRNVITLVIPQGKWSGPNNKKNSEKVEHT